MGKTPAVTVCQVRAISSKVLAKRPPTSEEIGEVLRRDEEARIDRRYAETKTHPPRRSTSGSG